MIEKIKLWYRILPKMKYTNISCLLQYLYSPFLIQFEGISNWQWLRENQEFIYCIFDSLFLLLECVYETNYYCKWNTHSYMLQKPRPTKLTIEYLQGIFLPFRRKWAKDCQQSNKSAIKQSINILVGHVFCAKLSSVVLN